MSNFLHCEQCEHAGHCCDNNRCSKEDGANHSRSSDCSLPLEHYAIASLVEKRSHTAAAKIHAGDSQWGRAKIIAEEMNTLIGDIEAANSSCEWREDDPDQTWRI